MCSGSTDDNKDEDEEKDSQMVNYAFLLSNDTSTATSIHRCACVKSEPGVVGS